MKKPKIVRVAEWDGWCGACGDDRPLVLTRTGRQQLRTWLTGAADDSRPLVLTCRLCGTGVVVPLEQDDPPVVVAPEPVLPPSEPAEVPLDEPGHEPALLVADDGAELAAGRRLVAQALRGLLAQRSAAVESPAPSQLTPFPMVAPVAAPALPVPLPVPVPVPLQRLSSRDGLTELQLLAEGIDLLGAGQG